MSWLRFLLLLVTLWCTFLAGTTVPMLLRYKDGPQEKFDYYRDALVLFGCCAAGLTALLEIL